MEVGHSRKRAACSAALLAILVASQQIVDRTSAQGRATESTQSAHPGDGLIGEWWTEGNEGRIAMARYKDGTYRGTTTCCKQADGPSTDVNNPKPELRNRAVLGIVLIWGLKYEDGEFVDGYLYNPRDGKTYRMKMVLVDRDTLQIRGYMGISLLGQTQTWKRAKK